MSKRMFVYEKFEMKTMTPRALRVVCDWIISTLTRLVV